MTAIEKLRLAFASQIVRNVNPHDELIFLGTQDEYGTEVTPLMVEPEREAWQDDAGDGDEAEPLTLFDMICALDEIAELMKRPPIDREAEPEETDPGKRYMQILSSWRDDRMKLAYYKEQEKEKRLVLFAGAFPNPTEGTQRHKFPDGSAIKGQYKINRKIDEAALPVTLQAMRDAGVANTDALVSYKPFLAKREWNTLSEDMKLLFSPAVIATPGTPTLDFEPPKGLKA